MQVEDINSATRELAAQMHLERMAHVVVDNDAEGTVAAGASMQVRGIS